MQNDTVPQGSLESIETLGPSAWPQGWDDVFSAFFNDEAGRSLCSLLAKELAKAACIYPQDPFKALRNLTPSAVRVVILGQDPYHEPGEATGLAFSVPARRKKLPPSLRNIFKEIAREAGEPERLNGDLSDWAKSGVLLLNTVLTVEQGRAASHAKLGWQALTDAIVRRVLQEPFPHVFLLWGAHAQAKEPMIEANRCSPSLVLKANHPSPLSARRPPLPFIGCGHFRAANDFLRCHGQEAILWSGLAADFQLT